METKLGLASEGIVIEVDENSEAQITVQNMEPYEAINLLVQSAENMIKEDLMNKLDDGELTSDEKDLMLKMLLEYTN